MRKPTTKPARRTDSTASVDAFFRSVYDSLSRRVLEASAAHHPTSDESLAPTAARTPRRGSATPPDVTAP